MTDTLDALRLARTDGVGPVTFRRLLSKFQTHAEAIDALPGLARAGGRAAAPVVPSRADAAKEAEQVRRLGGTLLLLGQPGYPPLLALLNDAPAVLTVLGDPAILATRAVAIVGSRNASANGQRFSEAIARELATAGIAVVSGLARGIDAAAHLGALDGGTTIACIAGGIDVPYPPEHAELQARIGRAGAVVTEAPLGVAPLARHFPRRNRLIAGLSLGVVVIEAALRSGSLITARLAQEEGRELFAVPGSPLDPRNRGSNDLLRQGAHITESAADVLDNLPDHPGRVGIARSPMFAREPVPDTPGAAEGSPVPPLAEADPAEIERARLSLLDLLGPSPTDLDELVRRTGLSTAAVMSALLELELAGRTETLPGNRVALLSSTGGLT